MSLRLRDRVEWRLGIAFWIVLVTTAALGGAAGTIWPYALAVVVLLASWPLLRRTRLAGALIDWLPFPFVIVTYESLHAVVPEVWAGTIDPWLRTADQTLFGNDVAALLEPISHPTLTVAMACAYASYYVAPLSLGVIWWRRRRTAFRELMVGEVGALFIGYLGYLFLPAIGPHAFIEAGVFATHLPGDFIGNAIRSLNDAHGGQFPRDAFPSLHTANAVTMILVLVRHERRLLWLYGPPLAGLIAATVYLRFHYVVDVVAGASLAIIWQRFVPTLVAGEPSHAETATIPTSSA